MHRRALPLGLSLAFVLQLLLRLTRCFAALPPLMATHFDLGGKPNGFQERSAFVWTSVLVSVFMLALFAALPALLVHLPERFLNLPNKDYWLAPERRAQTFGRLSAHIDWLGCATMGLLAGVFELIIRANLTRSPLGYQLWILLPGYNLFMLFWLVSYLRALRRPDGA
jgi:uncharacterized membrane protein